jgi:autoinducer 2 (AI-2) kinase
MESYLIIDIGTGNARVAVAAKDGSILSVETEDMRYEKDVRYPESIYFDTDVLWEQIVRLAGKALARCKGVTIKAFTATSQREGIVLLGRAGESLIGLPNIDHRGREWESEIRDRGRIYALTGRRPGSLFSAMKLVGVRNRRKELWEKVSSFLSISDWVQYKLSGVMTYEHSQASETLLYDVAGKCWSEELCGMFDLGGIVLPELRSAGTVSGKVLPAHGGWCPLAADAIVVVGGADTQLAIMSVSPSVDDMVIVSGTTTPITILTDRYVTDVKERTWTGRHTDEAGFMLEANAGVTGLNYQRLKEVFYPNEGYDVIERELSALDGSQCVAALGSLIADEPSPLTRGGFIFNVPVSHQLTRAHFVLATLWDIACSIRENYRTLCEVVTHDKDYIWACGGGMQSRMLRQMIANLVNKKVQIRKNFQQASVAGGAYLCSAVLKEQLPAADMGEVIYPSVQENYGALYEEWKQLRAALRQIV